MSGHPARFRSKITKAVSGTAFQYLKKSTKIEKASRASISRLIALGVEIEKNLTEIRAKYLIRQAVASCGER